MHSSVRLVVYAQICLWLGLAVCAALMPHFLLEPDEGGVSNYGTYNRTVVPYTLAFGLCGVLTLEAARVLPPHAVRRRQLGLALSLAGWLYLFALESTYLYQVNGLLDAVHIFAGILLFLLEIAAALWFACAFPRDVLQNLLLTVQIAGFILAALTFFGLLHVLFIAEIVTSLAFGALLIRAVQQAVTRP